MRDIVVRVEDLNKKYRLGAISSATLGADVWRMWRRLSSRTLISTSTNGAKDERRSGEIFQALQDVAFDVARGEALGIIGGNGAGKSTLLKILSRVTAPTSGTVKIKGRVASLLEVGTGFHPDLTGRENIFLNGAILGMSKAQLLGKFDEIVDFSGVEKFIDTPVKRYSSGMYVRLAFSVAAHLEADILMMDEVLAVGDAAFQRKCLGKMDDASRQGRTVLFVSHNMVAVQSLCSRALLLSGGRIEANGPVGDVIPKYLLSGLQEAATNRSWADLDNAPGNDLVRITALGASSAVPNANRGLIGMGTPVRIEIEYQRLIADRPFDIEVHLINHEEVVVLYTSPGACPIESGAYRSDVIIPPMLLNSGAYRVKLMLVEDESRASWLDHATVSFSVEDLEEREIGWMSRRPGVVHLPLAWHSRAIPRAAIQDDQ